MNEIFATTPRVVVEDRLKLELMALGIAGVKAYALLGKPGWCEAVYAWAGPEGVFEHAALSEADKQRIRNAIALHDATPPVAEAAFADSRDIADAMLLKTFILVALDEHNRIRGWLGKPPITLADFKAAMRQKLSNIT